MLFSLENMRVKLDVSRKLESNFPNVEAFTIVYIAIDLFQSYPQISQHGIHVEA